MNKINSFETALPTGTLNPRLRRSWTQVRQRRSAAMASAHKSVMSNTRLLLVLMLLMGLFILLYSENLNREKELRHLVKEKKAMAIETEILRESYNRASSYVSLETLNRSRSQLVRPAAVQYLPRGTNSAPPHQDFQKRSEYYKIQGVGF